MPPRNDSPNRSEAFGRLLSGAINSIATYEGKTAPIIEEELGALAIVAGKTIQRYKAGHLPPEPRTIEILAAAAIRRGFLGREWLERFLHAARYPFADKLLNQLCPIGPARPRPPRVYENLPAPTYSQFVMRQVAFSDVIDGLSKRSAAVLIVGLGGNGKTSLAREVADACLKGSSDTPQFDAAVWISDKDRPGTTNLSIVLDEIARTLDYPGFTQFEHAEKRCEVEQLLRRQRVLVVVDNFETISDGALLPWLLNLPEPSKALITTREYRREFRRSSWPVELRGMTDGEARNLTVERVRVLKIEKLVGDLAQLEPLLAATGGNPKALEITLGLIKYERRPLQQVVDDLYAARGELFDDLFTRAWALLDEAARRMLLALTFFPASSSSAALSATADVQSFAFDHAVERLSDLALVDEQRTDLVSKTRYTLHPLVRAFSEARLKEQVETEEQMRKRWMAWYLTLAEQIGNCWHDLLKLEILDPENDNMAAAIEWAFRSHKYAQVVQLARDVDYYYLTRGQWDRKLRFSCLGAEAAKQSGNIPAEVEHLAHIVQILSKQANFSELEQYMRRIDTLVTSVVLQQDVFFEYKHGLALCELYRGNVKEAQRIWSETLVFSKAVSLRRYIGSRRWIAECLHRQGELVDARSILIELYEETIQERYEGGIVFVSLKLAEIDLRQGMFIEAEQRLDECCTGVYHHQERRHLADMQRLYARLRTLRGDLPAARTSLTEAIDLFERLGMRRELTEARAELVQLNERAALTLWSAESSADGAELSQNSSATLVE